MKRVLFAAAAVALAVAFACNNNNQLVSGNDFVGPSGLAITSARDRDLLFIASAGGDDLKVINICTTPTGPQADGGVLPTTCPDSQDFHFVPGPVRVFPGSVLVGDRPVRVAGARLLAADGATTGGAALVAGADSSLHVVDAVSVVDAENKVRPDVAQTLVPLDAPPVDVIAGDQPGQTVRAVVATEAVPGFPAELTVLSVALDATGTAKATPVQKCSLDLVPTKLAFIPSISYSGIEGPQSDLLYVADGSPDAIPGGKGDGAVEIDVTQIPPVASAGPCPILRRLPATDAQGNARPLRSLALSPKFYEGIPGSVPDPQVVFAAGELLIGITAGPAHPTTADGGVPGDSQQGGTVVFIRTSDATIAPIPPFGLRDTLLPDKTPMPKMEPLRTPGLAREVAFLAPPPQSRCPQNNTVQAGQACTIVAVGNAATGIRGKPFNLVAVVTTSEGGTYFIDADKRRLFSDVRDTGGLPPLPTLTAPAQITPVPLPGQPVPSITFAVADQPPTIRAGHEFAGYVNPGVTRQGRWRAIWHAPFPGLERRGGTLTSSGGGLHLETPSSDLLRWVQSPELALGPGDVVAFASFNAAPGTTLCPELAAETALRIEVPITAVGASGFDLAPVTTAGGFNPPASCFPVGATVEVRTAASPATSAQASGPWLILEGAEVRGRAKTGTLFTGFEPRFDYPLDPCGGAAATNCYDPSRPATVDIGIAFTINAPEPTVPQTTIAFDLSSGQTPTSIHDPNALSGFAGPVITYSSPKVTNLIFTSITGSNSVVQTDPALIGVLNGVIAYR